MRIADQPFQFVTASYLTRIGNCRVVNLSEMAEGIAASSDASVFFHTFQTLSRHHFLTEGFSNDFAQWVLAACNRPELAEQLASLDIRDYLSLPELRADLHRIFMAYNANNPRFASQEAFEPFFFCDAIEVAVPLGVEVRTLEEFRRSVEQLSHASFYYHFVASRLRLHLRTNDFSHWLVTSLGCETLALQINRIDIYTNTVESARANIRSLVEKELAR